MKFQKMFMITILFSAIAFASVLQAESAEELFASKCGKCHKLNGKGKDKGPDLTGIVGKRSEGYVKLYIKDPKKASIDFPAEDAKRDTKKYSKKMIAQKKVTADEIDTILSALK